VNPAKIGTAVGAHVPPDAPKADIQLQILGLLRIWHRDVELDAGPRQQAYLLALLLARAGRPLSVDSLIDLIWGDPELAVRTVERRTLNLEHPNAYYLDIFARLCWCWARARTGDDPHAAAAEAETILTRHLLSPPMGGVAFNCALVADALLAADDPAGAARALDLAEESLHTYGQRHAEGLILFLRARLLQSRGEPAAAVREAAERGGALSVEREAYLFGTRAEELLAALTQR